MDEQKTVRVYYAGETTSPVFENIKNYFKERDDAFFLVSRLQDQEENHMNKICSDDIVMLNLDIKTLEHIEALREIKKQLRKKGPTLISIT